MSRFLQRLFVVALLSFQVGPLQAADKKKVALLTNPKQPEPCSSESLIGKRIDARNLSLLQHWRDGRWRDPKEEISAPIRQSAQAIVLHLWAPWCAPCREELPRIGQLRQKLSKRYGTRTQLLLITEQTPPAQMAEFLSEQPKRGSQDSQATLFAVSDQYHDPIGQIWESIKGRCAENKLPVTLVLSPDRVIVSASVGAMNDESALLGSIDSLVSSNPFSPEPTIDATPPLVEESRVLPPAATSLPLPDTPHPVHPLPLVATKTSEKSWLRRGPGWVPIAGTIAGIGAMIGLGAASLYYRQENQALANRPNGASDPSWFGSLRGSDGTVNMWAGTFWATTALTGLLATSSIVVLWDDRRHAQPAQVLTSDTRSLASELVP